MKTKHDIKATIKENGRAVTVYKHRDGGYVDSNDMNTKYTKEEITVR